ncbi:hypothetical protein AB0O30_50630, partial [Streptomyces sp. NPDC091215]
AIGAARADGHDAADRIRSWRISSHWLSGASDFLGPGRRPVQRSCNEACCSVLFGCPPPPRNQPEESTEFFRILTL